MQAFISMYRVILPTAKVFFIFVSTQKPTYTFNHLTNSIYEIFIFYFSYIFYFIVGLFSLTNKYLLISGQIFGFISYFFSNRWPQVVLDGKSSHEYPVNAWVPQGAFLLLHFSCYTLMTFMMMTFIMLGHGKLIFCLA